MVTTNAIKHFILIAILSFSLPTKTVLSTPTADVIPTIIVLPQGNTDYLGGTKNAVIIGGVCLAAFWLYDKICCDGTRTREMIKSSTKTIQESISKSTTCLKETFNAGTTKVTSTIDTSRNFLQTKIANSTNTITSAFSEKTDQLKKLFGKKTQQLKRCIRKESKETRDLMQEQHQITQSEFAAMQRKLEQLKTGQQVLAKAIGTSLEEQQKDTAPATSSLLHKINELAAKVSALLPNGILSK